MVIRVVDNKKLDMTDDEWQLYQKIVKSYTNNLNRGEDLFMDLFETNHNGIIVFLKPPSKRQTSFEIVLFLVNLMAQQNMRQMYLQVEDVCNQMKDKMKEIDSKLLQLEKVNEQDKNQ